jgi:hypothetical protein
MVDVVGTAEADETAAPTVVEGEMVAVQMAGEMMEAGNVEMAEA